MRAFFNSLRSTRWPALRAFTFGVSALIGLLVGAAYGGLRHESRQQAVAATEAAIENYIEIVAYELSHFDYPSVERISALVTVNPLIVGLEVRDAFDFKVFSTSENVAYSTTIRTFDARDPASGEAVGKIILAYQPYNVQVLLKETLLVGALLTIATAVIVSLLSGRYITRFIEAPAQKVLAAIEETLATDRPVVADHASDDFLGDVTRQFNRMQTRLNLLSSEQRGLIEENSRINDDLRDSVQTIRSLQESAERLLDMQNRVLETSGQSVRLFDAGGAPMAPMETSGAVRERALGLFSSFPQDRLAMERVLERAGFVVSDPLDAADKAASASSMIRTVEGAKDGDVLLLTAFRFDSGNSALLCRDVTDERAREAHLRHLLRIEAVGRLTGGVAHNFNNFLAIIMGNAEMALETPGLDDATRRRLKTILSATEKAKDLTGKLLGYVRRDATPTEQLDIRRHFQRMGDLFRSIIGAEHRFSITVKTNRVIEADLGEFDSNLINLIKNASEAMKEPGKISIEVTDLPPRRVEALGLSHDRDYVTFLVRDTGPGMDEKTASQVFDPFFTTKSGEEGVGLGLSSVYGSVMRSGGRITVDSVPGEGTTFQIHLPACSESHLQVSSVASNVASKSDKKEIGNLRILIVEDEEQFCKLLVDAFQMHGYATEFATSFTAAIAALDQSRSAAFDVFLTDIRLRDGPGLKFLEQAQLHSPNALRVVMSGNPLDISEPELVHHFEQKPFRIVALVKRVSAMLRNRELQ